MWRRSLSNHGDTSLAPIPAAFLMTPFEFVTVAVSFILGLGVTQLLSAAVATFRARHRLHLEWLPLLWALSIFLWMFQFWWAIYELASIFDSWTTSRFVTVLSMAMLLFTAGALVLPAYDTGETRSLAETFQADGRWALVFLSGYFGVSLVVNLLWWNVPVIFFLRCAGHGTHDSAAGIAGGTRAARPARVCVAVRRAQRLGGNCAAESILTVSKQCVMRRSR